MIGMDTIVPMLEYLRGRTIFVTGATGLIGKSLCARLAYAGVEIVAFVRDAERARTVLPTGVELVVGNVSNKIKYEGTIDYIIHAACPTGSKEFGDHPVEIMDVISNSAFNVLEFAKTKNVSGLVYLSTMEVYGLTDSDDVRETMNMAPDAMVPRNCYPVAKRFAECLFASAAKEYGIPTKVARLTQTFGHGVDKNDQRVFAQFARAAKEGRDIVLKSDGLTARCYCAIDDAVDAIMAIMVNGEVGKAYNVANPDTYCTIRQMAEFVAEKFSGGHTKVIIDKSDAEKCGYLPPYRMNLNVDRLKGLGWKPTKGLEEMFREVIDGL